jgi:hypothetical protein
MSLSIDSRFAIKFAQVIDTIAIGFAALAALAAARAV